MLLSVAVTKTAVAQDIPLFSQKITGALIYNPSLAGTEPANISFTHRSAFNQVKGGVKSNYLSVNVPIIEDNFGAGLNVFSEKINFLTNTHISAAFGYHVQLAQHQLLSMGVSAEYNSIRPDYSEVIGDESDNLLNLLDMGAFDNVDFSAGLSYRHTYFRAGIAANRLASSFEFSKEANVLSGYYTAQLAGMLPIREQKDLFEPVVTYRRFSSIGNIYDMGAYYTYNNLVMVGSSIRIGTSSEFSSVKNEGIDIINFTLGIKAIKQLFIGYTFETTGQAAGPLGHSNEITLRYDFPGGNLKGRGANRYMNKHNYPGQQKKRKKRQK